MKKTLLVALSFCCGSMLFAQRVSFGIKAGVNGSSITNMGETVEAVLTDPSFSSNDIAFKSRTYYGFHGGAFVNIKLPAGFALQPELLYSIQGKGFKVTDLSTNQKGTVDIKLNYINIPVVAQYHLPLGLYFEAGPQFGILTTAKVVGKAEGDSNSEDATDGFKTTDISLAVGAGFQLPKLPLGVYLRYNLGLTDVASDNDTDKTYKNSVFQLGIAFRLAKK